jgi:hypothetical protein
MVLDFDENVNDDFIRDIVKSLVEVLNTAFMMFFEYFEFRVLLVQFEGNDSSDDVGEHVFECKFVTVVVVDRGYGVGVFSLFSLEVCLLSHHTDGLVGSLDHDLLNISTQAKVVLTCLKILPCDFLFSLLLSSYSEVSSAFGVHEPHSMAGVFALLHVVVDHALSTAHQGGLVCNSLQFLVLKLFNDRWFSILRHCFKLITLVLFLDDF